MSAGSSERRSMNPLPAFAEGAVRPIEQGFLQERLESLAGDYPISRHHRLLLHQLGSEIVYAAPLRGRFENRWLALVRFGRVVESRFGLSAEVPLVYDHHSDLQIRTVDSIPEYLKTLPEDRQSTSNEICLLSTPDPQTDEKANRWSRPDRLLVPMPQSVEEGPDDLLRRISMLVFARDLYSVRGAVTGRDFFGRQRLINSVLDDVQQFRVPGVFGMRKSGKTSLLQELIRTSSVSDRRSGRQRVFVYQDLEHLSGFETGDPVAELMADLVESIRLGLKNAGLRTRELADLPKDASLPEFRTAFDDLLGRLEGGEVVLILDEIEYLCPPNADRPSGTSTAQKVPQLFGVFRKLVQERSNFGLVIAGLASSSVEASELYGRPNPLFSFAHPYYIGSFTDAESADLLRGIGKQLGLTWHDDAVSIAIAETGGNAMLLRELGSAVQRNLPADRSTLANLDRGDVTDRLRDWRRAVSSNLREVVLHLRRFYPDETALIEVLMSSEADFRELAYDYPDQIQRLEKLGVIEEVGESWVPSRVLQMGWELAARRSPALADGNTFGNSGSSVADFGERSLLELVGEEEGQTVERKETATYNDYKKGKDGDLERAVIKSIAGFMNSSGGSLLIGVADDGTAVGLERDFNVVSRRKDRDGFENWLTVLLCNELGKATVGAYANVRFDSLSGEVICCIDARPATEPVYVGRDAVFFVRVGNSTQEYNPREAIDYVARHWRKNTR